MRVFKFWTTTELRWIKNNLHLSDEQIGKRFKRSRACISSVRKRNKILRGNNFFPKGHKPWNAGMKGWAAKGTEATRFKKGLRVYNEKHNGAISIRNDHKDRNGIAYKFIRIEKGKWKLLHRYNWEKTHGKIPKGFIVAFKTKDTMNCEVENLELITRAENMRRNQNRIKAGESMKKNWQIRNIGTRHCANCGHEFVMKTKANERCTRCKSHATILIKENKAA